MKYTPQQKGKDHIGICGVEAGMSAAGITSETLVSPLAAAIFAAVLPSLSTANTSTPAITCSRLQ